jgi:hypothetical protein
MRTSFFFIFIYSVSPTIDTTVYGFFLSVSMDSACLLGYLSSSELGLGSFWNPDDVGNVV